MKLKRPYCVRGYKKGCIVTNTNGHTRTRKLNSPEHQDCAYTDRSINLCFSQKQRDINDGKTPCFDEGNMWCIPNDCSVFEANQEWWMSRHMGFDRQVRFFERDKEKILDLIKEISEYEDPDDLFSIIDKLHKLKRMIPSYELKQWVIDTLLIEGRDNLD